ncbi:MAG TPA: amidohydrolase family protein [Pleomorphomonadaceae bacterium]|nr:amidohydrolase family protein [Pleomorphomonadaceae bacterium]
MGHRSVGSPTDLVLRGARLVDGRGPRSGTFDVVLRGGRISAIGPDLEADGAETIDATGRWIVPGLMNAHAHLCLDAGPDPEANLRQENRTQTVLRSAARLDAAVRAGVTTIRDVGGPDGIDIELARLVDAGEILGPRVIPSGRVVTMTGGHGWWIGLQADGPDAVRRAARENLRAGARSIKLMATGGMMTGGRQAGQPQLTIEEMSAAVEEAHKRGVPVAAHAESRVGVLNALHAGVDSVEHGHGGDQEAIDLLLQRGAALVPTILSDRRIIDHGVAAGIPDFVVEQCDALHNSLVVFLEAAIAAGVRIAAGNDGGAPLVPIGDIVSELELYVAHGMRPLAALGSATIETAALFGLTDVGLVEEGQVADLLVIDGDPLATLATLRSPRVVIRGGMPVDPLPMPILAAPQRSHAERDGRAAMIVGATAAP